jgi:hypothetical protein
MSEIIVNASFFTKLWALVLFKQERGLYKCIQRHFLFGLRGNPFISCLKLLRLFAAIKTRFLIVLMRLGEPLKSE